MRAALFVVALACLFGGSFAQNATDCELYCNGMNATCPEVYTAVGTTPGIQVCMLLCTLWAPGNLSATGDTLGCRRYHLGAAASYAPVNNTLRLVHCSHAGPTGGTNQTGFYCGDTYDLYCDLFNPLPTFTLAPAYLCKDHGYSTRDECIKDVRRNVASSGQLVSLTVQVTSGDSIECRGSAAAAGANVTANKTLICPQSYWHGANYMGNEVCSTPCKSFCKAYGNTCNFTSGANAYADYNDCVTKCGTFPVKDYNMRVGATKSPSDLNSAGCRKYHTLVALTATSDSDRTTHCGHALPTSTVCISNPGGAGFSVAPVAALVAALMALAIRL